MGSSSASEVAGQAEDVIKALLEYLVDPLLPLKASTQEPPSLSQQHSVAKQVNAVVLLYNYYHRKQHPNVEFLGSESFCNLAVTLKPTLAAYMKFTTQSDHTSLDDLQNMISVTEKAFIDGCNMSLVLNASKDVPSTEGWPVSKVAVFLVDSRKANCLLLFSSITHGVWSVIEKDLDVSNICSEGKEEGKHTNKKKRTSKKSLRDEQDADEAGFQELAFSAIKDETGIDRNDLMILESHLVYSLSKEKTAARFYIVQCTQSNNEGLQVPIKDAVESLQGPLVEKCSCSWMVTPVVEYYHVLPYAGIVSDWLSREAFSNGLQDPKVELENENVNSPPRKNNPCDKQAIRSGEVFSNDVQNLSAGLENANVNSSQRTEKFFGKEVSESRGCGIVDSSGNEPSAVNSSPRSLCDNKVNENGDKRCAAADSRGNEATGANTESPKWKDNNECCMISLSNSSSGPQSMEIDDSTVTCPQNDEKIKNNRVAIKVYHHQKKRTTSVESDINTLKRSIKVEEVMVDSMEKSSVTECRGERVDTGNKSNNTFSSDQDGKPRGDCALVPLQLNTTCVEKLKFTLAAKEHELSQTALRVLLRKREKLSHQLRNIEDECAVCDRHIQTILDGGEDNLTLKIKAIVDFCNDVFIEDKTQTQDGIYQHVEDQVSPQCKKAKRLSEAILTLRSPCQDLDDICQRNKWTLPKYSVSLLDGGFLANVTVKGMDFECSGGSNLHFYPREARESAAAQMIAKIQTMAGHSREF